MYFIGSKWPNFSKSKNGQAKSTNIVEEGPHHSLKPSCADWQFFGVTQAWARKEGSGNPTGLRFISKSGIEFYKEKLSAGAQPGGRPLAGQAIPQ